VFNLCESSILNANFAASKETKWPTKQGLEADPFFGLKSSFYKLELKELRRRINFENLPQNTLSTRFLTYWSKKTEKF
jgi:hypothetical protein